MDKPSAPHRVGLTTYPVRKVYGGNAIVDTRMVANGESDFQQPAIATAMSGRDGFKCENRVQQSNHRVSRGLLATQMRHCHVYFRSAWICSSAQSPKPVLRSAGQ